MNIPNIVIKELTFSPSGTYPEQHNYHYQVKLSAENIAQVMETTPVQNAFVCSALAPTLDEVITLKPTEQPIPIVNGWNHQRLFFTMLLEYTFQHASGKLFHHVQGYTDRAPTVTGVIDNDMQFIINSSITYRESMEHTPTGVRTHMTVVDASSMLHSDVLYPNIDSAVTNNAPALVRPEDIFSRISTARMIEQWGHQNVLDARTLFVRAVKSDIVNDIPSQYIAKMLENYRLAEIAMTQTRHGGDQQTLDYARGLVHESYIGRDVLMTAISQATGRAASHLLRYQDLLVIQPDLQYKMLEKTRHHIADIRQHPKDDARVIKAHLTSNIVSGLMRKNGFTQMRFTANNRTPLGKLQIHIVKANHLLIKDACGVAPIREAFLIELGMELNAFISHNNTIDFNTTVMIDLRGESVITMALNFDDEIEVVIPIACSGLMSPVMMETGVQANQLAAEIETLIDAVSNY